MRNSLFFFFSFFLFKFSVKTKHAAYLVYAVTLEGEEKDEQKMAATSHGSRRGAGTTESASIWQHDPTVFSTSSIFFPASSIVIYFIVWDTRERQRPVAYTKLYVHGVNKLAFSSTVCVFGNRWMNKVVALLFSPFYRWCLCGWQAMLNLNAMMW